jgi:uncharacterized protein
MPVPEPRVTAPDATLRVTVVRALVDVQTVIELCLPAGATVDDALSAVAASPPFADLDLASVPVGVFGDRVARDRPLQDGDRVEIYRPLRIDPREARQRRAAANARGGFSSRPRGR